MDLGESASAAETGLGTRGRPTAFREIFPIIECHLAAEGAAWLKAGASPPPNSSFRTSVADTCHAIADSSQLGMAPDCRERSRTRSRASPPPTAVSSPPPPSFGCPGELRSAGSAWKEEYEPRKIIVNSKRRTGVDHVHPVLAKLRIASNGQRLRPRHIESSQSTDLRNMAHKSRHGAQTSGQTPHWSNDVCSRNAAVMPVVARFATVPWAEPCGA